MPTIKKPTWLKLKEDELKKIISDLAPQGKQPAQIGLILRDQYGVPTTKLYGKKLKQYLKELGIDSNPELENAEKKIPKIKRTLKNKHNRQKSKT